MLADLPSAGEVWMVRPPYNFAGTIESLNDGILFIEMEPGGETWHCGVWLSTYGLPERQVDAVREKLDARLTAILGTAVQDGAS